MRFAPPGVIVSAELLVLQFRGKTGAFLEPPSGKASAGRRTKDLALVLLNDKGMRELKSVRALFKKGQGPRHRVGATLMGELSASGQAELEMRGLSSATVGAMRMITSG